MKNLCNWGFCNETQTSHLKMQKHEGQCPYNPVNRLCFTCAKYIPGSSTCLENIRVFNVYQS